MRVKSPSHSCHWAQRCTFWPPRSSRKLSFRVMATQNNRIVREATDIIQKADKRRPELIVLDLDYTIWPFWCEMYSPKELNRAKLFSEAKEIIAACAAFPIRLAVASRSPTPKTASAFLKKLDLDQGVFEEILVIPYVGKDETHFPELKKRLGVDYRDMLFFDDEHGNIKSVSRLGVTSILVSTSDGLCLKSFKLGMERFAQAKG